LRKRCELLDRVLATDPTFFEKLIVSLLTTMGYGGSRGDAGRAIGKLGDGGLDGVIDEDPLGLDRVYIQAKRYRADSAVAEPEIRGFARKLGERKGHQGVFVTTSHFTGPASAFAEKIAKRIVLIDGDQLARLMVKYGVLVRVEETPMKQHLAAIRQLFDYLTTGGVLDVNPAASVRGPKYVVKRGKTPVLFV